MPGINNGGVANYLTLGVRMLCSLLVLSLRCMQLPVLNLRLCADPKDSQSWPLEVEAAGLRIRIDEGSSKEVVPTVHSWKNPGILRACNSTIIPLGAALSAASLSARLLGAS